MPTTSSLQRLKKSFWSKKHGKPEEQQFPGGSTDPTLLPVSQLPACDADGSIASRLSQPQSQIIIDSSDESHSARATGNNSTDLQGRANFVAVTESRGPPSTAYSTPKPFSRTEQVQVLPVLVPVDNDQASSAVAKSEAEEPQLATVSMLQPSISERVWNDAYDSLESEEDTAELAKAYRDTLAEVILEEQLRDLQAKKVADTSVVGSSDLPSELESLKAKVLDEIKDKQAKGATHIKDSDSSAEHNALRDYVSGELKDRNKRQIYMKMVVENGKARIAKASKITQRVGAFAQAILSLKPVVDPVIQYTPHAAPAALPWAGVCIALQILTKPAEAARSNLAGMTHVASRMDWYCALSEHLINKDNIKIVREEFEAIRRQLEVRLVTLYKALLIYQMKSICCYYRNKLIGFLRSLVQLDDWDGDLKSVTDAEAALQEDSDQYSKEHTKKLLGGLVEFARTSQSLLGDIRQDLRDLIAQQEKIHKDGKDKEFFRDLFIVDPRSDMDTIERNKDTLIDDAFKWILHTKEYSRFTDWRNDESGSPSCRLLWVKGHAGTGKTMLLMGIIRELSNQPSTFAAGLSFFFCQGTGDKTLSSATAILRSLIWLLLFQQPQLISHLRTKYEFTGPCIFNDRNAFSVLSDAFKNMLRDPRLSPTYLIVDALDECDQGLAHLIELISSSVVLSDKVRWLVSSRPHIKLKAPDTVGSVAELDSQNLADPVNIYIDYKLSTLKEKKSDSYDDDTLAEVSSEIRKRAENTFLWVALVFKVLESDSVPVDGWDAVDKIKDIPPGLSQLYKYMMNELKHGSNENQQRCKNVLVATSLAYRPLSLSELTILARLPARVKPQLIIEKCGSFLTVRENMVYLIHQSAKEFLETDNMRKLVPGGVAQGHADMGIRSIVAMSRLQNNIYSLQPWSTINDIKLAGQDLLEGLHYCCVYWVQHLQNSSPSLYDYDQIYLFLQKHFLHWLEALAWIRRISEGILAISSLEGLISGDRGPNLYAFIHDAKRFALYSRPMIEQSPLQLYCSALVFAPERSIIRKQFEESIPSWIQTKPNVQLNWDVTLQTLDGPYGHNASVNSVAFFNNSKLLASASSDKTVKIWDVSTGSCLQTLEGHSGNVISVAISRDSKLLASASNDKTIKIWDWDSDSNIASYRKTLKGHEDCIVSVAFCYRDSKQLLVTGSGKCLKFWNIDTLSCETVDIGGGITTFVICSSDSKLQAVATYKTVYIIDISFYCIQELEGHSEQIISIAVSHDSKLLASASWDKTIKIWDVRTGACMRTLESRSGWLNYVAFSHDSNLIASASTDKTICIYDADTGHEKQHLLGHNGSVKSIAFSDNSRLLASASQDNTIKIWDMTTDSSRLQMLWDEYLMKEDHRDNVTMVTFSHDSQLLASASPEDETIKIWDTSTGSYQWTLEGHSRSIRSIAFSYNSKLLASTSYDNEVKIWDASTGSCQQTFSSSHASLVIFSHDSRLLALALGNTIEIRDTRDGSCQQHFRNDSESVSSIAFSHDSKLLAALLRDKTIEIWDTSTNSCRQTIEGDGSRPWVRGPKGHKDCIAFSQDSKLLASSSEDNVINIWDLSTNSLQQSVKVDEYISNLSFGDNNSSLVTNKGRIIVDITRPTTLSDSLQEQSSEIKYKGIGICGSWITWNGQNLVWLPSDFRADWLNISPSMSIVAGGCSSGKVFQIGFSLVDPMLC